MSILHNKSRASNFYCSHFARRSPNRTRQGKFGQGQDCAFFDIDEAPGKLQQQQIYTVMDFPLVRRKTLMHHSAF